MAKSKKPHQIIVNCMSEQGGAVTLNEAHGVVVSYATAGAENMPTPEILRAGAKLKDGRSVSFFLNRETGLIVVDIVDKNGRGGCEILRQKVCEDASV